MSNDMYNSSQVLNDGNSYYYMTKKYLNNTFYIFGGYLKNISNSISNYCYNPKDKNIEPLTDNIENSSNNKEKINIIDYENNINEANEKKNEGFFSRFKFF
jgi:hypothetical protein